MAVLMGVLKNRYGVYVARRKVPESLQVAVAIETGSARPKQAWLQQSLATKDHREANLKAKPVLMLFDRILAKAEAATLPKPLQAALDDSVIERIAAHHYAAMLSVDESLRTEGLEGFPDLAAQFSDPKGAGFNDRGMSVIDETISSDLAGSEKALARGDVSYVRGEVEELLGLFRINLNRKTHSYRKLGMAVLREQVRAFKALSARHKGDIVETPKLLTPGEDNLAAKGETLTAALKGWEKARSPAPNTLREFRHAIDRFIELHGDMPVQSIGRQHVRQFREALQDIPKRRAGPLRGMALPKLVEWSREHPAALRVSATTVNKLLGGVQAVAVWARDNGLIPDEVPWADPFSNMRLDAPDPEREPWEIPELNLLFASPVFAEGDRPKAGKGEAAYWLPLMGLFSGARLSELAALTVADVIEDPSTSIWFISITEDLENDKRLKTTSSRRIVPVHPELMTLGFLSFVKERQRKDGPTARLFPLLWKANGASDAAAWSKWFGRYIRSIGITDKARVFHSFRHSFKDALRAGGVSEDINDALTGHAGNGGVGRTYGAKEMLRRFGMTRLAEALRSADYTGLKIDAVVL